MVTVDDYQVVVHTIDNAWYAIAHQYVDSPSEELRNALNLLAKMNAEIKSQLSIILLQTEKEREAKELNEWIEWLKEA